jgi:eukaryotic-like serine/threonine-protein kinase
VHALGSTDPPATLGPYTLLTKLASGGMATVFVGNKYGVAGFERLIAIKCCHPHLRDDEEFVTMFLDEARLAARIHHPNVVATLDVGCTDVLYLVMEYVEGDSLNTLLRSAAKERKPMPVEIAVRIMIDALTGLHAAHELCDAAGQTLNLVHRDVSPQNILVGVDGISSISDFGIAFAAARSSVTHTGKIKGKLSYMSPEQVKSQRVTRRSDVFSAGIVLWDVLTGRQLFRRNEDVATINAVLSQQIVAPSSLASHLPRALDAVVLKALERDPERRFQTAAEFAEALEQLSLERATNRMVAAYVQTSLGPVLEARRSKIREAAEQRPQTFENEVTGSYLSRRVSSDMEKTAVVGMAPEAEVPSAEAREIPAPVPEPEPWIIPADVEHRRMRGLLVAIMLMLVGSAVGLLLARSGTGTPQSPSPASSATRP